MKNIFLDEANRCIERGGVEGDISMIYRYGNFTVVEEDKDMTDEEKLKYGVEMLGIEVRNYEKREDSNKIKINILGMLAIGILFAMLLVSIWVVNISKEGVAAVCSSAFLVDIFLTDAMYSIKNNNRLVLFWIAYLKRILYYTELKTDVTFPVALEIGRAIKAIS